jgi:hypothetical protein
MVLQFQAVEPDGVVMDPVPPQLRFCETIAVPDGTSVAVGERAGCQYLVVALTGRSGSRWVCAPASDRAVACVRAGRASPWSVVRHSATGTLDLYRTRRDGSVGESVVLCSRLSERPMVLAAA